MKFKNMNKNLSFFLGIILMLLISYSLCSTHERPTSGYVSKRKLFCSTPFYIIIIVSCIVFVLFK